MSTPSSSVCVFKIIPVIVRRNRRIALKIIKNVDKYREAAMLEINVLNFLAERGTNVEQSVILSLILSDFLCLVQM